MASIPTMRAETALAIPLRPLTMPESKLTLRMNMTTLPIFEIEFARRHAGDDNSFGVLYRGNFSDGIRIISDEVV